FLTVRKDRKAVVPPHLILRDLFRVLDLRLEVRAIVAVKLAAERTVGDVACDPFPRERQFHLLAEIASRFLEAPYERTWIETRRLSTAPCPFGNLSTQRAGAGPFLLGISNDERQPRRIENLRAITRERNNGDTGATPKLVLYKSAHGRLDFRLLIKRR